MQKITPFLWFDTQAEQAVQFYVSLFKNAKILTMTRYGAAGPLPKGTVMTAEFELEGQRFIALNGGPAYKFNPAISFVINCQTQQEIDDYWAKLADEGTEVQCGWVTDKFGVSWQVVPTALGELLSGGDPARSNRVMEALFTMQKIDIAKLKEAWSHGG